MRILWVSVSPAAATGYGRETREIVQRLLDRHEIIICGHVADVIVWGGKQYYTLPNRKKVLTLAMTNPLNNRVEASNVIKTYIARYKPDVVFGFWDAFALEFLKDIGFPYMVMVPVDGPMTGKWSAYIEDAFRIITYSKFGYKELLKFFPPSKCRYIAHGIDTEVFKPLKVDKGELRKEIEASPPIPDDCFLFTYVAANVGDRKKIPLLIRTFKRFAERNPDAHLYLHTNAYAGLGRGYDLPMYRAMLKLEKNVSFPTYNPILEAKTDEELCRIYNASDVYIHNSVAEGFGLPILEACSCGIPVIVGRNSSCVELAEGHGWIAENVDPEAYIDIPVYVPHLSHYPVVDQRSLLMCMEEAYSNDDLRRKYGKEARKFALQYDWKSVMPSWFKLFEEVEEELHLFKAIL